MTTGAVYIHRGRRKSRQMSGSEFVRKHHSVSGMHTGMEIMCRLADGSIKQVKIITI